MAITHIDVATNEHIPIVDACSALKLNITTIKNFIHFNKMSGFQTPNGKLYVTQEEIDQIRQQIADGSIDNLKSRRNKTALVKNEIYGNYLSRKSVNRVAVAKACSLASDLVISEKQLSLIIAEAALRLIISADASLVTKNTIGDLTTYPCLIKAWHQHKIQLARYQNLLTDILCTNSVHTINDTKHTAKFTVQEVLSEDNMQQLEAILAIPYVFEPTEDVLGYLYISLKTLDERRKVGAYYTTSRIVAYLLSKVQFKNDGLEKVLDPCCGTGNFLLHLPTAVQLSNVYAHDIDMMSVVITRMNLALKYLPNSTHSLYKNITQLDFLAQFPQEKFDVIIGNPPWGSGGSKENLQYYAQYIMCIKHSKRSTDSFAMFIEQSLKSVKEQGQVVFVLPIALCSIKAHSFIRQFIMDNAQIKSISYIGDLFPRVMCPSIVLSMIKDRNPFSTKGIEVYDRKVHQQFIINSERDVTESFMFRFSDDAHTLLECICHNPRIYFLPTNTKFTVGLITGNNKECVLNAPAKGSVPILKGLNIHPYIYEQPHTHIIYTPELYQQKSDITHFTMPEKLIYRFISNKIIVAYDNKQMLTLNSANFFIPCIEGISMKFIMAVFNSSVSQFVFKKKFGDIKVLRTHLLSLPIPIVDTTTHDRVVALVDTILTIADDLERTYLITTVDKMIAQLFQVDLDKLRTFL